MPAKFGDKLVIAISSRALFNLDESHKVYQELGLDAYFKYQVEHEDEILEPGEAFPLVNKLLRINENLGGEPRVEVILLSRNSADSGLRVFNSIQHYKLNITRAAFCGGESPYRYVAAFGCHLFLSNNAEDVRNALHSGVAAATLLPSRVKEKTGDEIRFAFDGDAVLFSDASERIYKQDGLDAFTENEKLSAKKPMDGGPFKNFLHALQILQAEFSEKTCPIRTCLLYTSDAADE